MDIHFKHYRFNKDFRPRSIRAITIAVTVDKNGKIFLGTAACHEKDNFCRERGRELATERLTEEMKAYTSRAKKNSLRGRVKKNKKGK